MARKLTLLRDRNASSPVFRQLVGELITLLTYEAMRDVAVCETDVITPVAPTKGLFLAYPRPILVPIFHADLGMLEGTSKLLSAAEIGFLGVKHDEITLEAYTYVDHLPGDPSGHQYYVMDPTLTAGHTLIDTVNYLLERDARDVTCVCLLVVPEDLRNLREAINGRADVTVVSAAFDERLSENGCIILGLGDASDRLYGVVD